MERISNSLLNSCQVSQINISTSCYHGRRSKGNGPLWASQQQMVRDIFRFFSYLLLLHSEQPQSFLLFHKKRFSTSLIFPVIPPCSLCLNLAEKALISSKTKWNDLEVPILHSESRHLPSIQREGCSCSLVSTS